MPQVDNPREFIKRLTLQEMKKKLGADRSEMSPESQLEFPEEGSRDAGFTPDLVDFGIKGGDMPTMGIAPPTKGWNWLGKMASKAKNAELEGKTSGGFDKILNILKRDVRDAGESREAIISGHNELGRTLPNKFETVEGLSKQKAAGDTRKALEARAERIKDAADIGWEPKLPTGGHYYGLEPLEDTVVKGASLHKDYNPLNEGTSSKFNALVPPKFEVDPKMLQEGIELDARKRVAIDDYLSSKGMAPESMYVRTPKNSYVVQDKALESVDDARNKLTKEHLNSLAKHKKDHATPKHLWEDELARMKEEYVNKLQNISKLQAEKQLQLNELAHTSDMHGGNMMFQDGKLKTVDTQGYLVPSTNPSKTVYSSSDAFSENPKGLKLDWMEPDPISNTSRRSVIFNRKK